MKRLSLLLLFLVMSVGIASAQSTVGKVVSGTVISSEDGNPIAGATVRSALVKSKGTVTDAKGHFRLIVPDEEKVILVSFIGMKSQEVKVGKNLKIVLESESTSLDEVMVVAYGVVKKSTFTGSASNVSSKKLEKLNVLTVNDAISGLASGLEVSGSSGQPGAGNQIRIRGIGSINSNQSPLYVIDGVPMPVTNYNLGGDNGPASLTSLASLSNEDIASITVLKDAAAAALYGSRGANGVILITTKRGQEGKTQFSVKMNRGWSDFAIAPLPLASPKEAFDYKVLAYKNFLMLNDEDPITDETKALTMAKAKMHEHFSTYDPKRPESDYDWNSALFRKGSTRSMEFSARGGSSKTLFFFSLGYTGDKGIAVGSDFNRYSGRLNLDHTVNKYLKFGVGVSLSRMDQNAIGTKGFYYANPFFATRIGFLNQLTPIKDKNGVYTNLDGYPNNVKELSLNTNRNTVYTSQDQVYVELHPIEGLTLKSTNSLNLSFTYNHRYWSPLSQDGAAHKGFANNRNFRQINLTTSNTATYAKAFGRHNLDFLVGYEAQDQQDFYIIGEAANMPNNTTKYMDVAATPLQVASGRSADRLQSVLSRFNYNYDNRYYASVSYRADESSRLGADNRWGNFYSLSGSWRLTGEEWLKDSPWLNNLLLKASYGENGTLPTSWTASLGLYAFGNNYNSVPGTAYDQIANPKLSWEKNAVFNVGLEMRVFDRLSVGIDWYNRKTKDLLLEVPVAHSTGFESYWDNIGAMTNRGFEIELKSDNIRNDRFSWTTTLMLSHNKNTIDKLNGEDIVDDKYFPYILRVGESYSSIYLRDWAGVNPKNGYPQWYVLDDNEERIKETNGSYKITSNSREATKKIVGNADPLLSGALTNELSYAGFDLSFMFTFKVGGSAYLNPSYFIYDDGENIDYPVTKTKLNNYWTKPGENAVLPIPVYGGLTKSNYNSSRRVYDATFARLKTLSFGYNLPKRWARSLSLNSVRFYLSGNNLMTFNKEIPEGIDPETTPRGSLLQGMDFPPLKSMSFGVQVNF